MTSRFIQTAIAVGVFAAGVTTAAAQTKAAAYNPAAEVTISGTISEVIGVPDAEGNVGVHIVVKTAAGNLVPVRLGPAMFIGMANFSFLADDTVEVTGTRPTKNNATMVARTITRAGKTLTLRDEAGAPAWSPTINGSDGCGVEHPVNAGGTGN